LSRPWLSVLVPTFNGEAYLAQALDSVAAEGARGVEVVAVDDGSSDGTVALLDRYRDRLDLCVHQRRAGSWVANTNLALRYARGEIVSLLHQDDFWLPGRLAALRAQLDATPHASLVLHACRFVDRRGLGPWRSPLPPGARVAPADCLERLLVQNFVAIPVAAFRRDLALRVGGMDESLWYTADWDLWLKLASTGETVYLDSILAGFRVHPASQTVSRSRSLDEFRLQHEVVVERHLGSWPARSPAVRAAVGRAARASAEVNVSLAAAYHRQPVPWRRLAGALGALRPGDWRRLARDSRLRERVVARLRARLSPAR
jgi:glycosyltransferase involved in cell wall biosynthesis